MLCDHPNVEVKKASQSLAIRAETSLLVIYPGDKQALVGWRVGGGWGRAGGGHRVLPDEARSKRPGWESIPQNVRFKWREYVQTFKGKYSESGEPGQFFFWS